MFFFFYTWWLVVSGLPAVQDSWTARAGHFSRVCCCCYLLLPVGTVWCCVVGFSVSFASREVVRSQGGAGRGQTRPVSYGRRRGSNGSTNRTAGQVKTPGCGKANVLASNCSPGGVLFNIHSDPTDNEASSMVLLFWLRAVLLYKILCLRRS